MGEQSLRNSDTILSSFSNTASLFDLLKHSSNTILPSFSNTASLFD